MIKKMIAAAAAVSVAASPVVAQTSSLSVANSEAARAAAAAEGNNLDGGYLIPGLVAVAVILAILALTDTWPFNDRPRPRTP